MKKLILFSCLCFLGFCLSAQDIQLENTTIEVNELATGYHVPWEILWGPDDWLWMTERDGHVVRVNPETGESIDLLNINDVAEVQESGLLGMALHPDWTNHPEVFVVYTYYTPEFNLIERLSRFDYDEAGQNLTNEAILLDGIPANSTHSGSRIIITPDLKIIMSTGDKQDQPASQDENAITGKFLRMNIDGSPASDNPYLVGNPYVMSIGHRNAQGLHLNPNGLLYSSEHGPSNDDEFNVIFPGSNYGWPTVQGFCNLPMEATFCAANNVIEPLESWTPTLAVAGIDYYKHPAIPEWSNSYLMANLKASEVRVLKLSDDGSSLINESADDIYLDNQLGRLRDIAVAPDGRIFVSTSNNDAYGSPATWGDDKIFELKSTTETDAQALPDFWLEVDCGEVRCHNLSRNADSYSWDFGDGITSNSMNPSHWYVEGGSYQIKLTATNAASSSSKFYSMNVVICNAVPLPDASFTYTSECLDAQLSATSEFANEYFWDFGNDNFAEGEQVNFTFPSGGTFEVFLTTQIGDNSASVIQQVNIQACIPPTSSFVVIDSCLQVQFENSSENASSYDWDFGDGNSSQDEFPTHVYDIAGTYSVNLTTTNDFGSNDFATEVTVGDCGTGIYEQPGKINFYPNPSDGHFHYQTTDGYKADRIEIYGLDGAFITKMQQTQQGREQLTIDLSFLDSGAYFVHLIGKDQARFISKVVIIK